MKKVINSLFVIIAAMVTFAGCAKQEIDAPATSEIKTIQFFANSIETKTEFGTPTDGVYPTLWSAGDMVDVSVNFAQKKTSSEVECSDDFKSARFKVDLSSAEVSAPYTFYSVSPKDRLRGTSEQNQRLYVEIISEQTPLSTSVDKKAQLLFAKSATTPDMPSSVELTYQHLTAYGKFSLVNLDAESVLSIKLKADFDIAGKWDYFINDGSFVVRSGNGSDTIILNTESKTDIWFACAPVDVSNKTLTLTVTTDKGDFVKPLNFPADRKFEAGKISKFTVDMAGIEVEGSEEPEQPGGSEGTTTATLSSDEIKTKIAASKCTYGEEVTYNDADDGVIWTSTCHTDYAARPWLQMKKDASVYIGISSDTDIKEVVVTVTAAQNSTGGVEDITKHSSFSGTLSLNTMKDGKGEDVASGTANNNIVTLTPSGNNKTLYLKTSVGARVWNIDVKKSAGSGETPEPEQPKTLVSIAVSGQTTSYTVGDTFAFDGTVTATYSDGSTAEVEPTSVSTPNMTTEGEQAVTVTYTEGEETKTATYTITVTAAVEPEEPGEVIETTIADFLAAGVSETVWYQLTGKIKEIKNTTYGNFYLEDATGYVYVYGLTSEQVDSNDKSFSSLGLEEGDLVTLIGTRAYYANASEDQKDQVGGPAYYVSHLNFEVTPKVINVGAADTEAEFNVSCDAGYIPEYPNGVEELSVVSSSDVAYDTYKVKFLANETAEPKTYVISIKADVEGFNIEKTVTIKQAAAEQGGGAYSVIKSVADLSAGTYLLGGNNKDKYADGTMYMWSNASSVSGQKLKTSAVTFTNGNFDADVSSYVHVELIATAKSNVYYIKLGAKYLKGAVKVWSLVDTPVEWTFADMGGTKDGMYFYNEANASYVFINSTTDAIRTYGNSTKYKGIYLFKAN